MKLTIDEVRQVYRQLSADPIPDDSPVTDELVGLFGDHTFYLSEAGLVFWEKLEIADPIDKKIIAIQIASWTNEDCTALRPHDPERTEYIVDLKLRPPANDN